MKRLLFFLLATVLVCSVQAQRLSKKLPKVTKEDLLISHSHIDSAAGAMVLLDYGETEFDSNFDILFRRFTRIKIFDKSELERGNIEIPYFARDRVARLEANSYNLVDGEIKKTELSKSNVFDEKTTKDVRQKKITMSDVKEGTVIEYTYEVNVGSWRRLNTWYFQWDIPVVKSEYNVEVPEYFDYKVYTTGDSYILRTRADKENRSIRGGATLTYDAFTYLGENIPAFKEEPYMTAKADHISKISFELAEVTIPGSVHEKYMASSYSSLSKGLYDQDYYKGVLKKRKFLAESTKSVVAGLQTKEEKLEAIYKFIQSKMTYDPDNDEDNIKKIFESGKGGIRDINFLLTMMYREAGFTAYPVRLSTRNNGQLHPFYPITSRFNYTICYVKDGEHEFVLDASEKHTPFNVLPKRCLNGRGVIISDTNDTWVDLSPKSKDRKVVYGVINLGEDGTITGTIDINRAGYDAVDFRDNMEDKTMEEYKDETVKAMSAWSIDSHEVTQMEEIDKPVRERMQIEIEEGAESLGDLIYMSPVLYGKLSENPFELETRDYPVNFGSLFTETLTFQITIPEGFVIEEQPEQVALALPNGAGSFLYNVRGMGNKIMVTSKLDIKKIEFPSEEYPILKELYTVIVAKHAEQIVLKRVRN